MMIQSYLLMTYAILSLGALGILSAMILRIGNMMGDCPATGRATRSAAATIVTGYAAIGAGGVALGAAALVAMGVHIVAALAVLGLVMLCLGLGFGHAIATLRAVTQSVTA